MDAESIKELKLGFRGEVVLPQDASFKSISSGMANQIFIDRKPAIVCRPRGAADVAKAVKWAAENHLKVVPRSGGHG
jgi:FAD/FMN-containing dehydrogenase